MNDFKRIFALVGTRWCGGGNISDAEESLGLFAGTDACCRDHDKCPDNMDSGEVRNGLHNKGLFTRYVLKKSPFCLVWDLIPRGGILTVAETTCV